MEDPVQTWVRSARHGFDIMPMTVRILNVPPVLDGDTYAWPGVFATNSEEDWQQLSGVLSAAEFEQMNQFRDPAMGYSGLAGRHHHRRAPQLPNCGGWLTLRPLQAACGFSTFRAWRSKN